MAGSNCVRSRALLTVSPLICGIRGDHPLLQLIDSANSVRLAAAMYRLVTKRLYFVDPNYCYSLAYSGVGLRVVRNCKQFPKRTNGTLFTQPWIV